MEINVVEQGFGLSTCPHCGDNGDMELDGPFLDAGCSGEVIIEAHCAVCNQDFEHILQYDYTTKTTAA